VTKERIAALAEEMEYVPSSAARGLVIGRTRTIGICIPDLADPAVAAQFKGIEDAALENGYMVQLAVFHRIARREGYCLRDFQERRMEGVIIAGSTLAEGELSAAAGSDAFPIVAINRPKYPNSVNCAHAEGARLAVSHLLELGHASIGFVGRGGLNDFLLREYRRALLESADAVHAELLIEAGGGLPGGIEAAGTLAGLEQPPSAVFACSDLTALGLIAGLRELGLRVPGDFSVCGYGGSSLAVHQEHSLTTIEEPNRQSAGFRSRC
jgi:LacI family transcriptional regulator